MTTTTRLVGSAALALVAVATTAVVPASAQGRDARSAGLAEARAATAKFHSVARALEAGYLPTDQCVPGMGYHYVKPALFGPGVDPAQPEALLYADKPGGGLRLVGVEYIEFAPGAKPADDPHQVDPDGPQLFGQHFNGLMAGHGPGMPTHWDLHVWIWQHNRLGVFGHDNPAVEC
jgi:hypothetical protein